ncbi:MAG: hypothetical protein QXF76_02275 [Candidatus Anstonellales archaeon]
MANNQKRTKKRRRQTQKISEEEENEEPTKKKKIPIVIDTLLENGNSRIKQEKEELINAIINEATNNSEQKKEEKSNDENRPLNNPEQHDKPNDVERANKKTSKENNNDTATGNGNGGNNNGNSDNPVAENPKPKLIEELIEVRERNHRIGKYSTKARNTILFFTNFHVWALKQMINHYDGLKDEKKNQVEPVKEVNKLSVKKIFVGTLLIPGLSYALGTLLPASGSVFGMFALPYASTIKMGLQLFAGTIALKNLYDIWAFRRVEKRTSRVIEDYTELLNNNELNDITIEEVKFYAKTVAERAVNLAANGNKPITAEINAQESLEQMMAQEIQKLDKMINLYNSGKSQDKKITKTAEELLLEEIRKVRTKGRLFAWLRLLAGIVTSIIGIFGIKHLVNLEKPHETDAYQTQNASNVAYKYKEIPSIKTQEHITQQSHENLPEISKTDQGYTHESVQETLSGKKIGLHEHAKKIGTASKPIEVKKVIDYDDRVSDVKKTVEPHVKEVQAVSLPKKVPTEIEKPEITETPKTTPPDLPNIEPPKIGIIDPFRIHEAPTNVEVEHEVTNLAKDVQNLHEAHVHDTHVTSSPKVESQTIYGEKLDRIDPLERTKITEKDIIEASYGKSIPDDKNIVINGEDQSIHDPVKELAKYMEEHKQEIVGKRFEEIVKDANLSDKEIVEQMNKSFQYKDAKMDDKTIENFLRVAREKGETLREHVEVVRDSNNAVERTYDVIGENNPLPKDVKDTLFDIDDRKSELSQTFRDAKIPGNDQQDYEKYSNAVRRLRQTVEKLNSEVNKYATKNKN